jgi:hypothetical protein
MAKKTTDLEKVGGALTAVEEAEESLGMTVAEAAQQRSRYGAVVTSDGPASKAEAVAAEVAYRDISAATPSAPLLAGIEASQQTVDEVIAQRERVQDALVANGGYASLEEKIGLQQVQMLYGFFNDGNGLPDVHNPRWIALTNTAIDNMVAANTEQILCRLAEFSDSYTYDMLGFDGLFMIENEYFEDVEDVSEIIYAATGMVNLATTGGEFVIQEAAAIALGVSWKEYVGPYFRDWSGVYRAGADAYSTSTGTVDKGAVTVPSNSILEEYTGLGAAISSVASQAAQSLSSATKNAALANEYLASITAAASARDAGILSAYELWWSENARAQLEWGGNHNLTSDWNGEITGMSYADTCYGKASAACIDMDDSGESGIETGVGGESGWQDLCKENKQDECTAVYAADLQENKDRYNASVDAYETVYANALLTIFENIIEQCESGYFSESLCSEVSAAAASLVIEYQS